MTTNRLSALQIKNATPAEKPYRLTDGDGLSLLVMTTGGKLWRFQYRYGGKQKQLALGQFPEVGLADARERRQQVRKLLSDGVDPAEHKKAQQRETAAAHGATFSIIADELITKLEREGRAGVTLDKKRWLLEFARPTLGDRPITDIKAKDVLDVLYTVERRGTYETARRLRATIGSVFRYAIATARAENDPTIALRDALITPTVRHHAAITDPKTFGGLMRAIETFDGLPATRVGLKLLAYLFPRPGELRLSEWPEFDLDAAIWTIPATRAKMRRQHRSPLPRQAVAALRELKAITGRGHGKFAFPGLRTDARPISENTLNAALRRIGYTQDEMTAHGFRATASTLLNESGLWNPDGIERQLAHVETNDVRRAYARGEHWEERVRMMQWWADYVDGLREGRA